MDQVVPTIITTEAQTPTPISTPHTPLLFSFPPNNNNNNKLPNTQPQANHQQTTTKSQQQPRPAAVKSPPVKSILKSPSTISEKSIHFDDHIDVIPFDQFSASSTPPALPLPPDFSPTTTGKHNLDLFKPLTGVSQTEMAKNMLLHKRNTSSPPTAHQSQQSPHFSNEIEAIKKMLLEPVVRNNKSGVGELLETGDNRSNNRNQRSRVFIKSPTPMREIPNFPTQG